MSISMMDHCCRIITNSLQVETNNFIYGGLLYGHLYSKKNGVEFGSFFRRQRQKNTCRIGRWSPRSRTPGAAPTAPRAARPLGAAPGPGDTRGGGVPGSSLPRQQGGTLRAGRPSMSNRGIVELHAVLKQLWAWRAWFAASKTGLHHPVNRVETSDIDKGSTGHPIAWGIPNFNAHLATADTWILGCWWLPSAWRRFSRLSSEPPRKWKCIPVLFIMGIFLWRYYLGKHGDLHNWVY